MSPIKLGLPNRGEWIGRYAQMLRNMGGLGIRLLCLNWMASIGWFRTDAAAPVRGGALTTSFDASLAPAPESAGECVSEENLRENLYYFLDAVLPEAEKAGVKMALHPDDPPVSPLRGIGRILKSAEDYEKVFSRYDSKFLGATFCQATFKVAGENVKKLSADWIRRGKIFFIHIRDARGNAENFTETFIDEERGFVAEMLAYYRDPLRPRARDVRGAAERFRRGSFRGLPAARTHILLRVHKGLLRRAQNTARIKGGT